MANYELTQNIDAITGTSGNDVFNARPFLTANGMFASTLQQFDSIDGGTGTDTLNATLIADSAYLGQAYLARPTLTGIETLNLTAFSSMSGMGDENQAASTLDLGASSGVTAVTSNGSNNQLRLTNAGNVATYSLQNSQADDYEDGLNVQGITRSTINVRAINVERSYEFDHVMRFTPKSGTLLNTVNFTATNADVTLDALVSFLNLTSTGTANPNILRLVDNQYTKLTATGNGDLTLISSAQLQVSTAIDASTMTGDLAILSQITGGFTSYKGGSGADWVDIAALTHGALTVALGAGDNSARIAWDDTVLTTITALGGKDNIETINFGGKLALDSGAGDDIVTLSVNILGATNDVKLGDGSDQLDISQIPVGSSTDNSFDGGTGTDTLRAGFFGLTASQGASFKNFERLSLTSGASGTIDLAGLSSIRAVIIDQDATSPIIFNNVRNGMSFQALGNGSYQLDPGSNDTATNAVTVRVGSNGGLTASPAVSLNVSGARPIETLTIVSDGGASASESADGPAGDFSDYFDVIPADYNVLYLSYGNGTKAITISGKEDLQLIADGPTFGAVTTINASAMTGALDLTGSYDAYDAFVGMQVSSSGAAIIGGKGNDYLTGGYGADTFGLSAGGHDTVLYRSSAQSWFGAQDSINSFKSGDDKIALDRNGNGGGVFINADVSGIRLFSQKPVSERTDGVITLDFGGNVADLTAAQARIADMHTLSGEDYAAVYDMANHVLWIDSDQDGLLQGNISFADLQVELNNLSTFLWTDLILV